jgi:hypothetical protein
MLLRRVIEHVRTQNWTAVALDFVIVVVGVFIGIQVANWNGSRQDRHDEETFLNRLHDDIVRAEEQTERVRVRRLDRLASIQEAANVIFLRDGATALTQQQCNDVGASHYFNIIPSAFPALNELIGSGRVGIIQDADLRTALVTYEQAREALEFYIMLQATNSHDLVARHPDLIQLESYFDEDLGETGVSAQCNLSGMQASVRFRNDFSANTDMYDAFVRDALAPWSEALAAAHHLVDNKLAYAH